LGERRFMLISIGGRSSTHPATHSALSGQSSVAVTAHRSIRQQG